MEILKKADIFLLENLFEFKEEVANCSKFAELLSSGVDIFVNDSFSLSHKILASTVAITRFCSACVAGFHFEESLYQMKNAVKMNKRPYIAIIGGGNLYDKAASLHLLASKCDGLVFVGIMSFQIMHALGYSVPSSLIEPQAHKAALDIIHFAQDRNIPILCPKDFWCVQGFAPKQMEVFPAHDILKGWSPVDLGPKSLDEIYSLLLKCKKIIWIGPLKFKFPSPCTNGASKLAQMLDELSQQNCDVIAVGNMACKTIMMESSSDLVCNTIENASVVWEFLKGRKLPGIMALDRAYPFKINWSEAYHDPTQQLCPNPDFMNPDNRWRMLQQSLVEAVIELLAHNGKVFLQSDVEAVAVRMKELFLKYGRGRLTLANDQYNEKIDQRAWLEENPFGVRSDWEQHVLDRGAPMYRLMLSKSTNVE
ncbi:hypothetical protein JCGZ_16541 [Jatropha curcas]|uniref:Phosphoglycerate kinase n=1 Tax=Jatropha curcas TaxID=180498 RepID=A0A067JZ29_JATCU|nr:hypothetical protein JCGZ_16541 [Jatropha curcas]